MSLPHSSQYAQQSDQVSISETRYSCGITFLSKYVHSVSSLNLLILKSVVPSCLILLEASLMCDLAQTCVMSHILDSAKAILKESVKCREFYERENKGRFSSLLPGSIPVTHPKIIFSTIFLHLKILQFLSVSITKYWVFHIAKSKKAAVFIKIGQDTPGLHSSSPNSQKKTKKQLHVCCAWMQEFSTFHTSPETKPEITHEDNAGTALNRSLTVTNK